jgi:hypothetical protein
MDIDPAAGREMTLEAFADTILPGEKRSPDDRALAGVSTGGGAVAAGALDVLRTPEGGMGPAMDPLADALDALARQYAAERGLEVDPGLPAFVALGYADRVDLVLRLTALDNPERAPWISLAMFCTIAFDSAPHRHTTEAMPAGHPGLATIGFAPPGPDGLWRFGEYSYGRQLASPHPDTTPSGSPA